MNCSRVQVRRSEHEHHVVPDRSRVLDFEAHRIIDVFAHYLSNKEKVRVFPLYSLPNENVRASEALYYAVRRLPRRRTSQERRTGAQSVYAGTSSSSRFPNRPASTIPNAYESLVSAASLRTGISRTSFRSARPVRISFSSTTRRSFFAA